MLSRRLFHQYLIRGMNNGSIWDCSSWRHCLSRKKKTRNFKHHIQKRPSFYFPLNNWIKAKSFMLTSSKIFVNNQLNAQLFFLYVYFYFLRASVSYKSIIRRIDCINTTSGICRCVRWPFVMQVWMEFNVIWFNVNVSFIRVIVSKPLESRPVVIS